MDPFMVQPFGLSEVDMPALRLSRWLGLHGMQEAARKDAANARIARAKRNPHAVGGAAPWVSVNAPLRADEAPRSADVVVAALIGAGASKVRIAGTGHGTDATHPGDRDWLARPALCSAVAGALTEAGLTLNDIGLFEIDGMTLSDEALALEALGLATPGDGFGLYARAAHINPSGGSAAGWAYPAMGLVRFAECLFRVGGGTRHALAVGSSPVGDQTQTAIVLEAG